MNDLPPVAVSPQFKDRRAGLIAFGIVSIIIGCICALFVPLMFVGQALAARTGGEPPDYRMIAPTITMYGVLAVGFVWLGIGSIMTRRWARALLLVLAWMWLLIGIVVTVLMVIFLPAMLNATQPDARELPDAVRAIVTVISLAFSLIVFIAVPAAFLLFYRSPHVKATCEARNPVPGWTDRCPLPVLATSLGLAFAPVSMVTMLAAYNPVVPLFGRLVSGPPAAAMYVLLMVVWGYCAWATYKLKPAGWWVVTVMFALFAVSSLLTFARVTPIEIYQAMGYPDRDVRAIANVPLFRGHGFTLMMSGTIVPFIGYLVWIKKYFR